MTTNSLRYAGFWPRLGSALLDCLILLPLGVASWWVGDRYRLFAVYSLIPGLLFGLFFSVYLVRRFGGTPGKLIVGIRIRKLNGEPAGYREAILRYLPEFVLGLLASVALIIPLFHLSDAEYASLASLSLTERGQRMVELTPAWYKPLLWIQNIWIWGELIVLLTNKKRRALHDFLAGTVVVHGSSHSRRSSIGTDPSILTLRDFQR